MLTLQLPKQTENPTGSRPDRRRTALLLFRPDEFFNTFPLTSVEDTQFVRTQRNTKWKRYFRSFSSQEPSPPSLPPRLLLLVLIQHVTRLCCEPINRVNRWRPLGGPKIKTHSRWSGRADGSLSMSAGGAALVVVKGNCTALI